MVHGVRAGVLVTLAALLTALVGCGGGSRVADGDLADDDPQIRADAALRLGEEKSKDAVDSLVQVLQDPEELVRVQATLALGNIGEVRAVPALLELAGDPLPTVRLALVQALVKLPDPRSIPVLARLLYDSSETVRINAARALAAIPGPEALDTLLQQALQDESEKVRALVVSSLGRRGLREAVPKLEDMMKTESDGMRARAAAVLRDVADASSVPALIQGLSDPFYKVRSLSAHALGKISPADPAVRDALARRLLQESHPVAKVDLAWNLVRCGDPSGLSTIRELLFTGQPEDVRAEAAIALGDIGEASDLHLLEKAMSDKKGLVSHESWKAHEALKKRIGAS